ncbi:unnamed protein product [Arabidopsis arenosa]|uniref:Prokaryotic-type class I peptide chain release factors domain-containing protein n=1 Tax=Arabidopsis arenosa TaxID=38785 RepID=A0A8S2ATD6_ARAAE|nr:unnamed protein product [Arabidopsis arenosa]
MVLTVLGPLAGRSFAITAKPNLLLLQPTNLPLLRLSLPLSLPHFSSSSSSCRLRSSIVFAAQESNLSVSNENETSEWLMQDFYTLRKDVEIASARVEEIRASAGLEQLEQEIANLESKATDTSFWDDRTKAQETLSALNDLKDRMRLLSEFKTMVEDAETIVKLTEEMDSTDVSLLEEAMGIIKELNKSLDRFELTQLLSGPYDKEGAVVYITAGAGGTDAQDWADMLLRMYMRWGEKQRYKTKVVEMSNGEEAGIKSATLEIEGRYAYGYISGEKGTHRIVRQSPFNSKGLRQTSFSGVEVMPLLPEEAVGIEIPEEDLDISFTRAGGKGGQNVNKVETAVRITHIPTGVAVRCTEERSQLANKTRALIRLKAKLLVIAEEQRATEIKEIRGDAVKAEWGQQIRNYVFHPYKLVKDVRTGHETSDITSVMDGDLDPFIKAYLKHKYTLAMASAHNLEFQLISFNVRLTGVQTLIHVVNMSKDPATFIQGAMPDIIGNTKEEFFASKLEMSTRIAQAQALRLIPLSVQVKLNLSLLEDINDDLEFCFKVAKESIIILPVELELLIDGFSRLKNFAVRDTPRSSHGN